MRMLTSARAAIVRLVAAIVLGLPAASLATSASAAKKEGVPRLGHVFLIIGENTDYDHLTATNAPYLESTLRPRSAWMDSYFAATHWSQANYIALVTGQFTRCEQQDGASPATRTPATCSISWTPPR